MLGALREHIKRGLSQPQGPWGAGKAKDLDRATEQAVTHATKALHKVRYKRCSDWVKPSHECVSTWLIVVSLCVCGV